MDDPKQLLDRVISYLRQQQEMYGDFELKSSVDNKQTSPGSDNNHESSSEIAADQPETPHDSSPAADSQNSSAPSGIPSPADKEPSSSAEEKTAGTEIQKQAGKSETAETRDTSGKTIEEAQSQSHLFSTNPEASDNIYDQVKACQTLQELEELCKQTDVLQTDLEDTNLVFGVGNPDADLVLIGEAPGREEDRQGEPFVGRAGQLLNKILNAIDLNREDVYIANILKHRPPENRNPLPHEVKQSLPFLIKQLDLIQPKLILCLGKVAANTMLDRNTSLKSMRGTFHSFKDRYELMVTYHPAALLRNNSFKRPTWEDMKKLRKRYDELDCHPS